MSLNQDGRHGRHIDFRFHPISLAPFQQFTHIFLCFGLSNRKVRFDFGAERISNMAARQPSWFFVSVHWLTCEPIPSRVVRRPSVSRARFVTAGPMDLKLGM